jgi:hypothetical protein
MFTSGESDFLSSQTFLISFGGAFDALSNSSGVEYIGSGNLGGFDSTTQLPRGSFDFQGTAAPEPNSFVLVLSGVAIMVGIFWQKCRAERVLEGERGARQSHVGDMTSASVNGKIGRMDRQ